MLGGGQGRNGKKSKHQQDQKKMEIYMGVCTWQQIHDLLYW